MKQVQGTEVGQGSMNISPEVSSVVFILLKNQKQNLLEYSHFTTLCQFLLHSKANQLYALCIHISPLLGFPSYIGHYSALSRVPCAIQQVLISYLFCTQYQQCVSISPEVHKEKGLTLDCVTSTFYSVLGGFPGGASGQEPTCHCR